MQLLLPDIPLQTKLLKTADTLLAVIVGISLLMFAGWAFSIDWLKHLVPGSVAMNPLTAIFFFLLVISFQLKQKYSYNKIAVLLANIVSVVIFLLAVWKVLSVIYEVPFSLDLLLFQRDVANETVGGFANNMAPNTAFCFMLSAAAVLFSNETSRKRVIVVQTAIILSLMLAVFCLLGYVFGAVEFYEVQNYIPMSAMSAVCFFLFSVAFLFATATVGIMRQFTSIYSGSYMARQLFIPAFLLPVIIGVLRIKGQKEGIYNLEFGSALFVTSMILVFLSLIWLNTYLLNAREQKQDETIAEKNHLANLVEQTSDAILSTDTDFNIKSWNKGAQEIYGYSREEVLNKPMGSFLRTTLSPEKTQQLLHELLEKGYYTAEYQFYGKHQHVVHVQASVTVLRNSNNEVTGYVAVHRDISQGKQLEQQLREFNKQLEEQVKQKTQELTDVFERISEAFLGIDNNSSIVYANKKAEQLFGNSDHSIINTSIFSLFQQADAEIETALREALEMREYIYLETLLTRFDKWFELHIYPSVSGLSVYMRDITLRKKALQELNASEEKYRMFFENSMDGILITNGQGKIFGANKAACNIFGMSEEEIQSIGRRGVLDETDPNWKIFQEERERNGKAQGELRHFRKDGTTFLAEITSVKFRTASGETQANTIIRDITERRKAEEALYKSEEKYRNLIEQAGDGIIIFQPDGSIMDVNESAANFLGYSKDALTAFNISDLLNAAELVSNPLRFDLLIKGESVIQQRRMKHRNGSFIEAEIRSKRLHDGTNLAIIRDLTDRIQAQQQLQKEKDLLDSIINSLPGIFYFYDQNGKFIRWNKQFHLVTEYSDAEIAKMHPLDFFEGDDKRYLENRIGEVFVKGISDAEAHFVTKSGKRIPYYFTGARVETDQGVCLVGMGIDITERKRAELELQDSYQQIRRLTNYLQNIREEERTHIAREIHDELGQQLTVLKMDVAWMKKKITAGDTASVSVKMNEMLEILDGAVASVRRIATELRPSLLDDIGLIAAIEWQIDVFSKRTGITVNLEKTGDPLLLPDAYVTGLFRILQESLTNITRHSNANQVDIHLKNQNKEFILYIQDNGNGFDINEISGKKTLGLLGMRERSIAMDGTFTVKSKPGEGTKIEVRVPLT
ncbi:PAS domain S-box-containing protein [Lacibacter cauensis]|uniref:PAS domain S-box-containing protein n=1 Tax=Lacibacter cauensis TaxID=510947 RepID=A0A562SIL2_9BACT|nr:PAS domain S-box protein [Lacibacter cauensis]TWI81115.1 PAS domain S-box-containing protein [Lacibacter cauensis]